MSNPLNVVEPWYSEGLRFKCTECGQCCTGEPGAVWVSEEEIVKMAKLLNLSLEEFSRDYLRTIGNRLSLKEHPKTYDCVFLKDNKCSIYQIRPKQCRTFPWWKENLKTKKDWEEAAKRCEGIHSEAPVVPYETIQGQLENGNS